MKRSAEWSQQLWVWGFQQARVLGGALRGALVGFGYWLLMLGLVFPLLAFVLHALSQRWFYPQLLPREWTLEPLLRQLTSPPTLAALAESTKVALAVCALSLLVGYPAGRTLGTRTFRGKNLVTLLLFLPTVVPPVATGIGLNILFLQLRLAGTSLGVILAHLLPVLPYVVFTLAGVFARYDANYEQQALVLGAGRARVFFSITLPLVWPGIVVAALWALLISWSQYLLTLLIGSGRVITLPILLFSTVAGGNPTTISALALIFVAPLLLAIALSARYLAGGSGREYYLER